MSRFDGKWMRKLGSSCLLAGLLAGCAVEGPSGEADETLFETAIPEDFTFATTQALVVRGAGEASALGDTLAEIQLPSGELVHRGPLLAPVELSIPSSATTLQVTLRSPRGERVTEVSVSGGEAVVPVQ